LFRCYVFLSPVMVSVSCLMALIPCSGSDSRYFAMRGICVVIPLELCMAYGMGLFCCFVPWPLLMVSVFCLVACAPCRASRAGVFGWDLVMGVSPIPISALGPLLLRDTVKKSCSPA
jgi:hypothetical protein